MSASRDTLLARADRAGRFLENLLLAVLLFGLVGLASVQIVLRNVFSIGLAWGDGVVRLAVLWLAMLGAVAASRDGRNISINLANRWLPERLYRPAAALVDGFTAAAAGLFAWQAARFVADSRAFGDRLLDGAPAWVFQLILPVAFGLIAYRYLVRLAARLRGGP